MAHIAGDLDRDRAARAAHAEVPVILRALFDDHRHRGERDHVVDDRRLAEQALMRRQRRLGAHDAALAFQGVQQRRFLAADIGARADADLHVEGVAGAEHRRPEHAVLAGDRHRLFHGGDGAGIFRADVDIALGRAGRDAGNRHALDQHEGIALHDHAVGEGAAVALVGVADDVFLRTRRLPAPSST